MTSNMERCFFCMKWRADCLDICHPHYPGVAFVACRACRGRPPGDLLRFADRVAAAGRKHGSKPWCDLLPRHSLN